MNASAKGLLQPGPADRAVGVCGLYCGACPLWQASHDRDESFTPPAGAAPGGDTCAGCRSDHRSKYCLSCDFRDCAAGKGLATCAECDEMPCERLEAFSTDGVPHHAGVVSELAAVRQRGEHAWHTDQRRRWSCPGCGVHFTWYSKTCADCGRPVAGLDE